MSVYCVDCGSNVLSNVKIRGAEVALSFGIGNVSLQNVKISSSVTALSLPSMASLQMTNCRFYDNQYVVNARDASHVNVSSCVFERNQYGIRLRQVQLLDFVDTQFSGSSDNLRVWSSSSRTVLIIKRSKFVDGSVYMNTITNAAYIEDCLFTSGRLDINYLTVLLIKGSRFVDSSVNVAYYNANISASVEDCDFNSSTLVVSAHYRTNIWSTIANSTFHSSRVRVSILVVPHSLRLSIVGCSFRRMVSQTVVELNAPSLQAVVIADNIFQENSRASCITVNVQAVSSDVIPGSINIVGNSFTNHSGANVIVINDRAYHHVQLRRNVFQNPLCLFEIEVQSLWRSGYTINSSENWWGSTNHTYIAERVSDVFVDSTKAKVSITSVYSDPEMTQLEALLDPRTWNVNDRNVAGGELDRNVTLTGSNIPYLVNKTIYIPKGFQLHLKDNATLHFAEKRGIIVEGM